VPDARQDVGGPDESRVAGVVLAPPERGSTRVGSHVTSWLSWGDPSNPTIVLVHGGAAHAWWWSLTAALLSAQFHVVAMDLAGHGSSDWRARYTYAGWVEEVLAVALPHGRARPVLVGHSMGGIIASLAAAHPEAHRLAGIAVVDAPVVALDHENYLRGEAGLGTVRTYPDEAAAAAAFQLRPRQAIAVGDFHDFVARKSVRRDDGTGTWTWRYDPRVFAEPKVDRPRSTTDALRRSPCPLMVVVGERSTVMTGDDLAALESLQQDAETDMELRVLPGAGHHLMFDDPWLLTMVLREVASRWTSQESRT
jgi:pimeloyl-ACP methyl ester carboxylesterase